MTRRMLAVALVVAPVAYGYWIVSILWGWESPSPSDPWWFTILGWVVLGGALVLLELAGLYGAMAIWPRRRRRQRLRRLLCKHPVSESFGFSDHFGTIDMRCEVCGHAWVEDIDA